MAQSQEMTTQSQDEDVVKVLRKITFKYIEEKRNSSHSTSQQRKHGVNVPVEINEIDILSGLLTGLNPKEVLIFGEENYTFCLSLATLRNNCWDGITVTCYYERAMRKFDDEKLQSIEYCSTNGRKLGLDATAILGNIKTMQELPAPPPVKCKGKVVWFQCPWEEPSPSLPEVIEEMKGKQEPGDYLLFGITIEQDVGNPKQYNLSEVLQRSSYLASRSPKEYHNGYHCLGVDKTLIRKMLLFGYRHNEAKVHADTLEKHVTLVFQRKDKEPTSTD